MLKALFHAERGWALVSVLWCVTILSAMAVSAQMLTQASAQMEQRFEERAKADAVLDAAVARAVIGISDQRVEKRWRVDGAPIDFRFQNNQIEIRIQDELSRIDLNAADGSMLNRLLLSAGVQNDTAQILTDRILDWRSPSGVQSGSVAKQADYAAAGKHYYIRHGPFQSVSELQMVLGITPELFKKIEPALTVYTGRPAFDTQFAPEEVLRALYLYEPGKIEEVISKRQQNSDDGIGAPPGILSSAATLAGRAFTVTTKLYIGKHLYVRKAVVELTGDNKRPYFFLAWL